MDPAEAFLLDQIPSSLRHLIPTTIKNAYSAANALMAAEPILQVTSAKDNDGRVVQWAVDLAFERLVKSGQWPFDYSWKHYERPTGRYLEIRPSHSVLTISQVADPKKQPRDVRFRANKRLASQAWLTNLPNPNPEPPTSRLPHVLLIHGRHGTPHFAHLGIPHEKHHNGYRYKTNNLLLAPHAVADQGHPMEDTDYEVVMSLKDEIDKWRRDNGA